jgi:hypothetical protein
MKPQQSDVMAGSLFRTINNPPHYVFGQRIHIERVLTHETLVVVRTGKRRKRSVRFKAWVCDDMYYAKLFSAILDATGNLDADL